MFASSDAPRSGGAAVRIGIVDLMSLRPESMTRKVFAAAVAAGAARLGWRTTGFGAATGSPSASVASGRTATGYASDESSATCRPDGRPSGIRSEATGASPEEATESEVAVTFFGIDPLRASTDVDWPALAAMDALIVSGSEPKAADIAAEPSLAVVDRILRDCSGAASLLFSCQSAHAALHLLHGLQRHRLPYRAHGAFDHWVHGAALDRMGGVQPGAHPGTALVEGLATPVRVPHSRWNAMTSADLREAGVDILLDSEEAEWHLATGPDGLRHVFLQGHPEYLPDTMAREHRRDLRRWLSDPMRPFPAIPSRYFPHDTEQTLLDLAVRLRTTFDPTLLDGFPLPTHHSEVMADWTADAEVFFANWIRAVAQARSTATTPADPAPQPIPSI